MQLLPKVQPQDISPSKQHVLLSCTCSDNTQFFKQRVWHIFKRYYLHFPFFEINYLNPLTESLPTLFQNPG